MGNEDKPETAFVPFLEMTSCIVPIATKLITDKELFPMRDTAVRAEIISRLVQLIYRSLSEESQYSISCSLEVIKQNTEQFSRNVLESIQAAQIKIFETSTGGSDKVISIVAFLMSIYQFQFHLHPPSVLATQ